MSECRRHLGKLREGGVIRSPYLIFLWCLFGGVFSAPSYANAPGFSQGKQFAGEQGGPAVDGSAVQDVPDGGGSTSQQRGLFQEGQGDAVGPGMTKIGTCASKDDPECSAINYMNQNPAPDYPISETDPLVTGADEIKAKAEEIAGPNVTSEAACIEQEITTPDQVTEERCETFRHGNKNVCDVDRVIQVDADSVYECKDGSTMDTRTCAKKRVVEVVTRTRTTEEKEYKIHSQFNFAGDNDCGWKKCGTSIVPDHPHLESCWADKTDSGAVTYWKCYRWVKATEEYKAVGSEYWNDACSSAQSISPN